MNKYFIQLFLEESTVIIPGFGALTMTDEKTGEIMFLPYLKFDDGKLANYISKTEGVDAQDAQNTISKFAREIQTTLDQGDTFDIYEFGSFNKNEEGEIEFQSYNLSNLVSAKKTITPTPKKDPVNEEVKTEKVEKVEEIIEKPIEAIKEDKEKKKVVEKKIEEIKKDSKDLLASMLSDESPEKAKEEIKKVIPKEDIKAKEEKIVPAPVKEEKVIPAPIKKEVKKVEEKPVEAKKKKVKAEKPVKVKSEKKKRKLGFAFWLLSILVIALLAGGTYFAMNYDTLKSHIPFLGDKEETFKETIKPDADAVEILKALNAEKEKEAKADSLKLVVKDSKETETTQEVKKQPEVKKTEPKSEPIKPAPQTKTVNTAASNLSYHVIIGAFGVKENAENYVKTLIGKGFDSSVLDNGGKLTLVSIGSFASMEEAQSNMPKFAEYKSAFIKKVK